MGHPAFGTFWETERLRIVRHCDSIFTLEVDGIQDMGPCRFEEINRYIWMEYEIPGFVSV